MQVNDFDTPGNLMKQVQQMLHDDPRTIPDIYRESGIPFYWLKKFGEGQFKNPSVNRVEYLYSFLTGKDLSL